MGIYLAQSLAIAGACFISCFGIYKSFKLLERKQQGIGLNSLRLIGLFALIPFLLILALLTEINKEALTAIIGTMAGYVLGNIEDRS